ncbi:gluconate 2-dehydrogenase subunit 3 family protein [Chryseolinea lacunae]|uniref:Gluconate 2-dehydrogenase subunit 3 family protein n=1 Tax=Chryseolinea lacunae TaxID=2801331 RepID=A0ABS1KX38_9BACT|nr:gluconate 2-dehydrogenase subunit 3 family protein [Chryseolinea lacunae]MBL0743944.1 gluconate 2-dehydrogenase subunit 3 family protein [Chryseolinea lacunae]
MNRRESLKMLMAASGGLLALPAWAGQWHVDDLATHASSFVAAEQAMLAAVVDTILPQGVVVGGLSVGVDKFLQKLFDHCYDATVQANIKTQLAKLEASASAKYGQPFSACAQYEREALLMAFAHSADASEKEFFTLVKAETIRGFSTSREVMTNYLEYKTAPGHYYGCVDVNA